MLVGTSQRGVDQFRRYRPFRAGGNNHKSFGEFAALGLVDRDRIGEFKIIFDAFRAFILAVMRHFPPIPDANATLACKLNSKPLQSRPVAGLQRVPEFIVKTKRLDRSYFAVEKFDLDFLAFGGFITPYRIRFRTIARLYNFIEQCNAIDCANPVDHELGYSILARLVKRFHSMQLAAMRRENLKGSWIIAQRSPPNFIRLLFRAGGLVRHALFESLYEYFREPLRLIPIDNVEVAIDG